MGVGAAVTGKGKVRARRAFGAVLRWETDAVGAGQKGRGTANGKRGAAGGKKRTGKDANGDEANESDYLKSVRPLASSQFVAELLVLSASARAGGPGSCS